MGRPRLQLHDILVGLVDNVYFQPPNGLKLNYPCILYQLDTVRTSFADNRPHRIDTRYMITIIDRNPDSEIPKQVALLPLCTFDRFYTADNLNHYVYNLYF